MWVFFLSFFFFLGFFQRSKPCVCKLPCTVLPSLSPGCLRAVGHGWAGICFSRAGFPKPKRALISHWAVTPSTSLSSPCCPGHRVPHKWPQRSPSASNAKMEAKPLSPALSLRAGSEGETRHSLAFPSHQPGFACGLEPGEAGQRKDRS